MTAPAETRPTGIITAMLDRGRDHPRVSRDYTRARGRQRAAAIRFIAEREPDVLPTEAERTRMLAEIEGLGGRNDENGRPIRATIERNAIARMVRAARRRGWRPLPVWKTCHWGYSVLMWPEER